MARNLQPRSALTPPRSPAPINATRPDFPVRAGQFFGAYASPDHGLALCAATLRGSSSPIRISHSLLPRKRIMMWTVIRSRNPGTTDAVSSQSLLARAPDTITRRDQRLATASPCRHGRRRMHSTRSRRNGAPWPSADARIFSSSITAGAGGTITARSNSSMRMREAIRLSERWAEIAASAADEVVAEHAQPVADMPRRTAA